MMTEKEMLINSIVSDLTSQIITLCKEFKELGAPAEVAVDLFKAGLNRVYKRPDSSSPKPRKEAYPPEKPQKPFCVTCRICIHGGRTPNEFYCIHPDIRESAAAYEEKSKQRISKSVDFIGYHLPRTSLRWCPRKTSFQKNERGYKEETNG